MRSFIRLCISVGAAVAASSISSPLAAAAAAAAAGGESAASGAGGAAAAPQQQQQIPSLSSFASALPPLDLSAAGLESLFKDLLSDIQSSLSLSSSSSSSSSAEDTVEDEKGLTFSPKVLLPSLVSLLFDVLKAAEGLLLPEEAEKTARDLTERLRVIFGQESLIRQKLSALQALAEEETLNLRETTALQQIAEKLWEQYKQLEGLGVRILKELMKLLVSLFPQLQGTALSEQQIEALQQQGVQETKALFPNILN